MKSLIRLISTFTAETQEKKAFGKRAKESFEIDTKENAFRMRQINGQHQA